MKEINLLMFILQNFVFLYLQNLYMNTFNVPYTYLYTYVQVKQKIQLMDPITIKFSKLSKLPTRS
jgi:hypothetical protein